MADGKRRGRGGLSGFLIGRSPFEYAGEGESAPKGEARDKTKIQPYEMGLLERLWRNPNSVSDFNYDLPGPLKGADFAGEAVMNSRVGQFIDWMMGRSGGEPLTPKRNKSPAPTQSRGSGATNMQGLLDEFSKLPKKKGAR